MRYLSFEKTSNRVILVPLITGDSEKWVLNNDIFPDQSPTLESGSCISTNHYHPLSPSHPHPRRLLHGLREIPRPRGHSRDPSRPHIPRHLRPSNLAPPQIPRRPPRGFPVSPFLRIVHPAQSLRGPPGFHVSPRSGRSAAVSGADAVGSDRRGGSARASRLFREPAGLCPGRPAAEAEQASAAGASGGSEQGAGLSAARL